MSILLYIIFSITVLIISVVVHEVAHGAAAASQGDMTAKYAGRLTLNPLKHLDFFGSFLLPLTLFLIALRTGFGIVLGYAKPVPVNPYNFRDRKWGQLKVAVAGVAANFGLALIFGLVIRFWPNISNPISNNFNDLLYLIVQTNLGLAVFNLMPIPPLDGSHILLNLLPSSQENFKIFLQNNSLFLMLFFLFFLLPYISPIVSFLFYLITGVKQ
jgi:Zn-dependent protease